MSNILYLLYIIVENAFPKFYIMKKILLFILATFTSNYSFAQLQADFSCVGVGFDACCGNGFHDYSTNGSSPIITWNWDFGNGETSTDQHPYCICFDSIGYYTVCLTITDAFGNTDQLCKPNYIFRDSIRSRCLITPGIYELDKSDFNLYPNPAFDHVFIHSFKNESYEVSLVNFLSKVVYRVQFNDFLKIDLDDLTSGIYVYIIRSKQGNYITGKLTVL